ncbi:MAG: leucyl/phenylalanyl-tRNA--protein transferase [Methylococcales bacterium]|nr:leucyl/phenylalanyl-tRNA--protein transferase [Methylococcales bacterium]
MQLTQLDPYDPEQAFPALHKALTDPNGLLAYGGCLSPSRIVNAYRQGIFPWYNPGEPILWWSPNPRLVLFPDKLLVSRSLQKTVRKQLFEIHYDRDFAGVVAACAAPRRDHGGTWITAEMQAAYLSLHKLGVAHSAETWQDGVLVGGLYGLGIGRVFFGESMFHHQTDASKVAFASLVRQLSAWGYQLIDCQVSSDHLLTFGAEEIGRQSFQGWLRQLCDQPPHPQAWRI